MERVTYVVSELTSLLQEYFLCAPSYTFESTFRMNIRIAESAKKWLDSMMKQSMCTYRHSKKAWIETGSVQVRGNALPAL